MTNKINDSEATTFPSITNGSNSAENATPPCYKINKTRSSSKEDKKSEISKQDMNIALGVTISISVLVVSFMLFMIGRLLYKTRHVKRMDPPITSFDIVNPSDGVFENQGGFIHETYIHIRKVSESNTDESPVSSPHGHGQDSNFGTVTSGNSRSHYGEYSSFTGHQQSDDVVPHRYSVYGDRGEASRPRK
ncbi:uncharacterized protein LOC125669230 [Ostrea edulis]|uniref:uncharacterized protein LOC125669230 n=1 Tax=Ostrea edulis TaxID=37623 RepID=UPI0024AEE1FA|nr:uncharacterized protein LOC125669230 [Ostrea edulis]